MRQIEILSPVSLGPAQAREPNPPAPSLRGRRLGIRRDRTWRSFEIFADEVERLARDRLGVAEVAHFDPGARIGAPETESDRVAEFARGVEAAVVGLGT